MEEKFILELTKDEVLMLQELADTSCSDFGYQWLAVIAERLETKAKKAYSKPHMSQAEFKEKLDAERAFWKKTCVSDDAVESMALVEECRLRFYYDVEEVDEQ